MITSAVCIISQTVPYNSPLTTGILSFTAPLTVEYRLSLSWHDICGLVSAATEHYLFVIAIHLSNVHGVA